MERKDAAAPTKRIRESSHQCTRRGSPALRRRGIYARCFCAGLSKSIGHECPSYKRWEQSNWRGGIRKRVASTTKRKRKESERSPWRRSALRRRGIQPDAFARGCRKASGMNALPTRDGSNPIGGEASAGGPLQQRSANAKKASEARGAGRLFVGEAFMPDAFARGCRKASGMNALPTKGGSNPIGGEASAGGPLQ